MIRIKRHSFVEKTDECLFLFAVFVNNDENKLLYMVYLKKCKGQKESFYGQQGSFRRYNGN